MDMNWVDTQEMNIWGIKYWSVFDTDMSLMIQVLQRKKIICWFSITGSHWKLKPCNVSAMTSASSQWAQKSSMSDP